MLSANQLANPRYGVLYLPVLTLLYLWSIPEPADITLLSFTLTNDTLYLILAGVGFIGAQLAQQFFIAIFGRAGPEVRPKRTTTALKHIFSISMKVDPSEISESAMASVLTAIPEILEAGTQRKAVRALVLYSLVWFSTRLLAFFALILSLFYVWNGATDVVLILLLLGMLTIYVQKYISHLFPEVHPSEAAQFLDTPEYKRWEQALSDFESERMQNDSDQTEAT